MANVDSVPAGKYGKAALETLGVWDSVADRMSCRPTTCAPRSPSSPAARRRSASSTPPTPRPSRACRVIGAFPADSHPPILYPVALTASSANPDARAFFDFHAVRRRAPAYRKQGFTVVAPGS